MEDKISKSASHYSLITFRNVTGGRRTRHASHIAHSVWRVDPGAQVTGCFAVFRQRRGAEININVHPNSACVECALSFRFSPHTHFSKQFASRAEATCFCVLLLRTKCGEIASLTTLIYFAILFDTFLTPLDPLSTVSVASSLPTGVWPWPLTPRKRSASVWQRGSHCFVSAIMSAHCTPGRFNSVTPLSFRMRNGASPCGRGAPKSVCCRNGSKRRRHRFVSKKRVNFNHHSLVYL